MCIPFKHAHHIHVLIKKSSAHLLFWFFPVFTMNTLTMSFLGSPFKNGTSKPVLNLIYLQIGLCLNHKERYSTYEPHH